MRNVYTGTDALDAGAGLLHKTKTMNELGDVKVLFVAGFGPIVREAVASRRLYGETLVEGAMGTDRQPVFVTGRTSHRDHVYAIDARREDLAACQLPRSVGKDLHEYVRGKYDQLWDELHALKKKYVLLWRNKFLTVDAKSIDDMIETLSGSADELRRMKADGITLDPERGTGDGYAYLTTTDAAVAKKYDLHDESEFFGDDGEGEVEEDADK